MTKKLTMVCAGLALAVAVTGGCAKKSGEAAAPGAAKASAAAAVASSVTYKAPDGSFTVELPEKYKDMKVESQNVQGAAGAAGMATYMAGDENAGIMFMVAVMPGGDVPAGTDMSPVFDRSLKGMVGTGTLINQSKVMIDGNAGISARVKKTQGNSELYMDWSETFINKSVYQISVMTNDQKRLDSPEAQAFMKSLKFAAAK